LEKGWIEAAYRDYSFGRLSLDDVAIKYKKGRRTIQRGFAKLPIRQDIVVNEERHINIVFDGVYFGRGLCYLVFRANGHNIYYKRVGWETVYEIVGCLKEIEGLGYIYKSFTIDGRKGLKEYLQKAYPDVPVQYCQFHQKQTIRQCITLNPKTECGNELKELVEGLGGYD